MAVEFHPAALNEVFEAGTAYEIERPFLGDRFTSAVARTIETLAAFPRMGRRLQDDLQEGEEPRAVPVRGFPYSIIYSVTSASGEDTVCVYSVAHERRGSRHWRGRLVGPT